MNIASFLVPLNPCTFFSPIQFQASSWKNLILKVCRGAYPPLPSHLPYELHYLFKQMFKTNPRDRPSVHTILTSHRASRLLRAHLSWQVMPPPSPLLARSEVQLPRGRASCAATVNQAAQPEIILRPPIRHSGTLSQHGVEMSI